LQEQKTSCEGSCWWKAEVFAESGTSFRTTKARTKALKARDRCHKLFVLDLQHMFAALYKVLAQVPECSFVRLTFVYRATARQEKWHKLDIISFEGEEDV